jgi:hypothetical protein
MSDQIDDYVKRSMRYQNVDGLNELFAGVGWTGLMLLLLLRDIAPPGSIWHHRAAFPVGGIVLLILLKYCQEALKKRLTYLRTGYVKYRQTRKRVWSFVSGALAAVAVALATVFVLHPPSFKLVLIVLVSAAWGVTYARLTRMDAAWRWIVLVALIATPPLAATLPLSHLWPDTFIVQGLILVVSGAITLTLYLRQNPVPEQVAE